MSAILLGILVGVLAGVIAEQICATFPSLALKLGRWSAACRYAGNPAKAKLRAEEIEALIKQRPGGLLKLGTALGFAIAALATASRRALGKNPVITIGRVIVIGAVVIGKTIWFLYCFLCFLLFGAVMFGAIVGSIVGGVVGAIDHGLGLDFGLGAALATAMVWGIACFCAAVAILREEGETPHPPDAVISPEH